jgi:energy-coupling factor transporter ATP-binding protein EcfA2
MSRSVGVDQTLLEWVEGYRQKMRRENQDLVLPVTGQEGSGKSTLALMLAMAFDERFAENLEDRVSWNVLDHIALAQRCPRFGALVLDEGDGMLRRDHVQKENRKFARFLKRCRKMNLVHILCTPEWEGVDKVVHGWRARVRIEVTDLGEARVRRRSDEGYWGKWFEFEFPALEGLGVWDRYEGMAEAAARGEGPHQDVEGGGSEVSEFRRLVARVEDRVGRLGQLAREEAGLEG